DGLLGRFDALGGTQGPPGQWVGKFAPGRELLASEGSAGGEQRTCGQEFKKLAPAGSMISKRWHGDPPSSDCRADQLFRLGWTRHPVHPTHRRSLQTIAEPSPRELHLPTTDEKRATFRKLHSEGCFVIPNPWDVGSARYLQGLGFKALATTSSGFAFTQGLPDGAVSRATMLAHF